MDGEIATMNPPGRVESALSETPWMGRVAAGSLFVSALLLVSGKRKAGLAAAAAGTAIALLENPKAVRDAWNSMPRYLRAGQDFLVRIEDFVDELNKQGSRVHKVLNPE